MELSEKELQRKARNEAKKAAKLEKFNKKTVKFDSSTKSKKKKIVIENEVISTVYGEKKDVLRELPKTYNPIYTEEGWSAWWENKGYFKPEFNIKKSNEKYSMVIPPPNVTGALHIGHALTISVEDCIIRYNRMLGKQTLWLPGTDHAGIATQTVVEKKIMRERGLTRHDLGREKFLEEVFLWKNEKGGRILDQCKKMGASCDFSRLKFTMDESMSKAVVEAFIRLYNDGSIYRAKRLINWSCTLKSAISEIEVEKKELEKRTMIHVPGYSRPVEFGVLVNFAYEIEGSGEKVYVATTRIETMLGDTAICVHPEDERYKHLHNKFVIHPFRDGAKLPVVLDDFVDREFGTGVVKITPAHDHNDYDVGIRHNLEFLNIFTDDGLIEQGFGEFSGMKRFDCRRIIMTKLEERGLLGKVEDNKMVVPICSRSKDIIEPMIKNQWFLKCQTMADSAAEVVRNGHLKLLPEGVHDATWFRWLQDCHDWCISRQLWWGHRIPMYRVKVNNAYPNGEEDSWIQGRNEDEALQNAKEKYNVDCSQISLEQDPDVLDTWFSSQLFPFSTMGWPNETEDLSNFFPGNILETGHDILFFWVARMVMIGLKLTGKIPFTYVYLHAIIRDAHGRKMSKSLGNVLDPYDVINGIELIDLQKGLETGNLDSKELDKAKSTQAKDFPNGIPQCGTDALRFALILYTNQSRDINLNVDKVFGWRTFCNKLWQALKYCRQFGVDKAAHYELSDNLNKLSKVDLWILSRLASTVRIVNDSMESYKLSFASDAIYRFWLYDFCDVYIEYSKNFVDSVRKSTIVQVMLECLNCGLRLLHPMMPFITEELYQRLPQRFEEDSIVVSPYPQLTEWIQFINEKIEDEMKIANEIVRNIRSVRKSKNINDKETKKVIIKIRNDEFFESFGEDIILSLTKCVKSDKSDKGELLVESEQMQIWFEEETSNSVDIGAVYTPYFTIKCEQGDIENKVAEVKTFDNYDMNEKERLLTMQWCNWLNEQHIKGKSLMKETLEYINDYLRNYTYLADTKKPFIADSWLLLYIKQNNVNDKLIERYVNLKRWFDTVINC